MRHWYYIRKAIDKYLHRQKPKFSKGDYVLFKRDNNHFLYAVYAVYESGYSLIGVHTGIVLPNIIHESKIIKALVGVDYKEE